MSPPDVDDFAQIPSVMTALTDFVHLPVADFDHLLANVEALDRRGLLNLEPRADLVVWPEGLIDVKETSNYFRASSLFACSASNWGETFRKQEGRTSCGLVSAQNHAKILLSMPNERNDEAKNLEAWTRLVSSSESRATEYLAGQLPTFARQGLTLEQLCLFVLNHSDYEIRRNAESVCAFRREDFEAAIIEQINEFGSVFVNYVMTTLGQRPCGGHVSLIVALASGYDAPCNAEQREIDGSPDAKSFNRDETYVLLLDCWPETPVAWVPIHNMFDAMNTPDFNNRGKYRGFLRRIVKGLD